MLMNLSHKKNVKNEKCVHPQSQPPVFLLFQYVLSHTPGHGYALLICYWAKYSKEKGCIKFQPGDDL